MINLIIKTLEILGSVLGSLNKSLTISISFSLTAKNNGVS